MAQVVEEAEVKEAPRRWWLIRYLRGDYQVIETSEDLAACKVQASVTPADPPGGRTLACRDARLHPDAEPGPLTLEWDDVSMVGPLPAGVGLAMARRQVHGAGDGPAPWLNEGPPRPSSR